MPDAPTGLSDIDLETILPKLTEKQTQYLIVIAVFFKHNQYYPSRREIAADMNVTVGAVNESITLLEKKGYLTIETGERRNIRLTSIALRRLELIEKMEG